MSLSVRTQLFACAVLAVCVAPAGMASPSVTTPDPTPANSAPADIGTFSSRLVVLEDGEDDPVARAYAAGMRMRVPDSSDAGMREMLNNAVFGSMMAYSKFDFTDGEFAGTWEFVPPSQGGLPTRAWRDIDASIDGYAAERIGYCKDTRESCTAWFEAGRDRSPSPRLSAGGRAFTEWTNRVMEEPCRLQADHRPDTTQLQVAMARSGIEKANLLLVVLLNPCGEVRNLSIETSSGSRDVDRVAARWARGARFVSTLQQLGSLGRHGTLAKIPFSLSLDP